MCLDLKKNQSQKFGLYCVQTSQGNICIYLQHYTVSRHRTLHYVYLYNIHIKRLISRTLVTQKLYQLLRVPHPNIFELLPIVLPSAHVLSCYSDLHIPTEHMVVTPQQTNYFKFWNMHLPVFSCKICFITKLSNFYRFPVRASNGKRNDVLLAKWNSCVCPCKE